MRDTHAVGAVSNSKVPGMKETPNHRLWLIIAPIAIWAGLCLLPTGQVFVADAETLSLRAAPDSGGVTAIASCSRGGATPTARIISPALDATVALLWLMPLQESASAV